VNSFPTCYFLTYVWSLFVQELLSLGKHQLLVYDDDVNILGGSVLIVKENA
jgi:hypothetical protein